MADETTATLDDVMEKLESIEGKLDSLTNSVKGLGYIGGNSTVVDTNVNSERTFVVHPWPPEAETTEDENEDTQGE